MLPPSPTPGLTCYQTLVIYRYNSYGQLGLNDTSNRGTTSGQMGDALPFVQLGTGQTASAQAVGRYHTCALLTGGVKCWGCAPSSELSSHSSRANVIHMTAASRGCQECVRECEWTDPLPIDIALSHAAATRMANWDSATRKAVATLRVKWAMRCRSSSSVRDSSRWRWRAVVPTLVRF